MKYISFFLIFCIAATLAACGGDKDNHNKPNTSPHLQHIEIVPTPIITEGASALTLAIGNSQPFIATGYYDDGTSRDLSNSVSWLVANPEVAKINTSGLLTSLNVGTTQVTATENDITSNPINIIVTAATITAIQVTPKTVSIAKGQTQQLVAIATYSDNTTADITQSVNWISEAPSIATISHSGLLIGAEEGETVVTADKEGITSDPLNVRVSDATITSIQITPNSVSIAKGQTQQLTATAFYSDNTTTNITQSVKWLVADSSIAHVTEAGLLVGMTEGSTFVTASIDGISSKPLNAIVTAATITAIQVTPNLVSLAKGQIQQLTATATYSDNTIADITHSVAWASEEPRIAIVSPMGVLTGEAEGKTTVSARIDGITSKPTEVTVTEAIITSLKITPEHVTVAINEIEKDLYALATYSDESTAIVTSKVAWLPADQSIATITQKGELTGITIGSTTVTADIDGIESNATSVSVNPWATVPGVGNFSIPDGHKRNWDDANAYCSALAIGDTLWRMPNNDELQSLWKKYQNNRIQTQLQWPSDAPYYTASYEATWEQHYEAWLNHYYFDAVVHMGSNLNYVTCIQQK